MTKIQWPKSLSPIEEDCNFLEVVCPRCKGKLVKDSDRYGCGSCAQDYPIVAGIPDFRIAGELDLDIAADLETGRKVAAIFDDHDFKGLWSHYWTDVMKARPELAKGYMRHALTAVERSRQAIASLEGSVSELKLAPSTKFLELGCGSGGFLAATKGRVRHVVGVDLCLAPLIAARKRLSEAGITVQLVCCSGDRLPFPDRQFDLVFAGDVIEHTWQQKELIEEAYRVLQARGVFFAATPNRFSLTPEPHVKLWGVGWLPRSLGKKYVRWVRRVAYDDVRLVSGFELLRMARGTRFDHSRIELPVLNEREMQGDSALRRSLVGLYNRLKNWPVVHSFLFMFGPVLNLVCIRDCD